jgi:hypothetical protein
MTDDPTNDGETSGNLAVSFISATSDGSNVGDATRNGVTNRFVPLGRVPVSSERDE